MARTRAEKMKDKRYRTTYVDGIVHGWLVYQMRELREQRGWSQGDLAKKLGKPPSGVSRLENSGYGKATVNTLLEIAAAFDVALTIKFVDHPTFLENTRDLSPEAMRVASFG